MKKIKEGNFFKIEIEDKIAYCRITINELVSFYDYFEKTELTLDEIISRNILFTIPVYNRAFKKWEMIGNLPVETGTGVEYKFFMQDVTDPSIISIFDEKEGREIPANYEECIGLERYMVWDAEHVESRLKDYFEGRPNVWVEYYKLKKPQ